MRSKKRRRLRELRRRDLDSATEEILLDPSSDIGPALKRVENYGKLLSLEDDIARRGKVKAVAIGILCVTVLGLGQVIRMPATRISLTAQAETVTFTLSEDWLWENPAGGSELVRVGGFSDVELPSALAAGIEEMSTEVISFSGGSLSLAKLYAGSGGRATLEVNEDEFALFVKDAQVTGELTLNGSVELESGSITSGDEWASAELDLVFPEIVTFSGTSTGAVPAQLIVDQKAEIRLNNVPVRSLSFARERASNPGSVGFESTIHSARLVISETREEIVTRRGDHIEIGDASDARLLEVVVGDTVDVAFEGKASSVALVQAGTRTDLRPTLLEYLYHNERLVFLWSALGIIWGMAWSVRRAIR